MKLSIRLKLSLGYMLIMLLTTALFIVTVNVVAQTQLHKSPEDLYEQITEARQRVFEERWSKGLPTGPQDADLIIEEIRAQDLAQQRSTQVVIYVLLMVASFGVAYLIAGWLLKPLHEALRLQTQFIENASHELKTPLTIVQTNLESALHDPAITPALTEHYIEPALNSTTLMNTLIEDLLLLSVTKQQVQFTPVDLAEVVRASVSGLTPMAAQAGRTLESHVPSESLSVPGNAALLQRAVMNCIENAIKYGKQHITVSVAKLDKQVHVTITDDGIGMTPEQLAKVGERFYRVDSSRSKETGGTGLGVAITRSIVQLHSGSMEIQSTLQQGTTVTLHLPKA